MSKHNTETPILPTDAQRANWKHVDGMYTLDEIVEQVENEHAYRVTHGKAEAAYNLHAKRMSAKNHDWSSLMLSKRGFDVEVCPELLADVKKSQELAHRRDTTYSAWMSECRNTSTMLNLNERILQAAE